MAGILFVVNVPKKEYENQLKTKIVPNLNIEKNKNASKHTAEFKEQQQFKNIESYVENYQSGSNIVKKCKSTSCLYQNSDENGVPYKINSETVLADGLEDQNFVWNEIKHILKPNKNKLKISRPVRSIDVLGAFSRDTPLETILSDIVSRLDIKNATWNSTTGDQFWQVTFSLESGHLSEELLQVLRTFGIGSCYQSSVCLLPCALYYKSEDNVPNTSKIEDAIQDSSSNTAWSRFSSTVRARTNLAQVLHDVRAKGALTFDWVFMLLVAALVAAIGLIENSTVILVASMLISPLMGPITAGTLGTVVRDRSLRRMGVRNEFLGLFFVLVAGFLVGLVTCALDELYGVVKVNWPTDEMLSRCENRSLWIGILVAIPSGVGCALAVLGDYTASLVGVAISASLLPPAVNAGLLWSMSLTRLIVPSEKPHWLVADPSQLALLGTASLCLTLVNIVCIFLAGVAVYKVKEVSPLDRKDITWWRTNKNTLHSTKLQNKEESLNWDAYTQWCTNSLESKDTDALEKDKELKQPSVTVRRRSSIIQRLRAQNLEPYCHRIQLEENYINVNSKLNLDHELQIKMLPNTNETEKTDEDCLMKSITEPNTLHSYYNLSFESDVTKSTTEAPTIEPSLSITVEKK